MTPVGLLPVNPAWIYSQKDKKIHQTLISSKTGEDTAPINISGKSAVNFVSHPVSKQIKKDPCWQKRNLLGKYGNIIVPASVSANCVFP